MVKSRVGVRCPVLSVSILPPPRPWAKPTDRPPTPTPGPGPGPGPCPSLLTNSASPWTSDLDPALLGRALSPCPVYKVRVDLWLLGHKPPPANSSLRYELVLSPQRRTLAPDTGKRRSQVSNRRSRASPAAPPTTHGARPPPLPAARGAVSGETEQTQAHKEVPPGPRGLRRRRSNSQRGLPGSALDGHRCLGARGVGLAASVIETRRPERRRRAEAGQRAEA
ncbi:hypothetical protein J1605_017302 [Eschrichtius robustus]|uniref:Uncharacterized protein n=1 Tax=Eschrichtius robustus TaxID=9764 RepID=A0AB34I3Q1_ESCRO|nr:hypothetical protein J1605_017302 [Eschrichtius robustus]